MDKSPNLGLPLIAGQQAQKHVTHNEALRVLDAIAQLGVLSATLATPPASPDEGERYIVPAGATGEWTGHAGDVAAFSFGAWAFHAPRKGWWAHVADLGRYCYWTGSAWADAGTALVNPVSMLGVNATADAVNRLAVASDAALFNAAANDIRLVVNKAAAGGTASVLYQTGWSGRAEFGTTGDDDFHLKVSADGGTWIDAMRIERGTGLLQLAGNPTAALGAATRQFVLDRTRDVLTANRTYYVRTDGNDADDGLASSTGRAFLTPQRGLEEALKLDLNGFTVTIQLADGTYTGGLVLSAPQVGAGRIDIAGNLSTPAAVHINRASGTCVDVSGMGSRLHLAGLKLSTAAAGSGIRAVRGGEILFRGNMEFGACQAWTITADQSGSVVRQSGNATISGGSNAFMLGLENGIVTLQGMNIEVIGNPNFGQGFARADRGGRINHALATITGGTTGPRFHVNNGASIFVNGAGASYFPGSAAGTDNSGKGYYI